MSSDVRSIKEKMNSRGLGDKLYDSLDEVPRDEVIVAVLDEYDDGYDVKFVGYIDGVFGQYASWISQELDEEFENTVWKAFIDIVKNDDEDKIEIAEGKYGWYFTEI